METNKILSSLCYFSVFFAAFLFPIIVYFVAKDLQVKSHAKRAFFSHLLPFITAIILFLAFFLFSFSDYYGLAFAGVALAVIVNIVVVIWNIIQGIKVLMN